MPIDPKRDPSLMSGYGAAMGLAAELVVTTGVGVFLGWLVDGWLNTRLIFIFVGGLMGMVAGVLRIYRTWVK
ncbi:MAG: AtpZ/AtpI family protein [Actinomycetota bacterium]